MKLQAIYIHGFIKTPLGDEYIDMNTHKADGFCAYERFEEIEIDGEEQDFKTLDEALEWADVRAEKYNVPVEIY